MSRKIRHAINGVLLAFGLVLLVLLIGRLDPAVVFERLASAGWYFPVAFLAYVLGLMATTAAWRELIDPARSRAGFGRLLMAFWAGHAVNSITPTGSIGEVLKGNIMANRIDGDELIASLITFNFMSTLSVQMLTLAGPILAISLLSLPARVVGFLLGCALAFFIPVAALYILLRLGAAKRFVALLAKVPFVKIKDPDKLIARAKLIDQSVLACRKERPQRFRTAAGWLVVARLLQPIELWILLIPLLPDRDVGWLLVFALLIQTASQLVAWAMTFVPGQFGVAEGATAVLFGWLGLVPLVGLSMELLRRIRKIIGVAVGLAIGLALSAGRASTPSPAHGQIEEGFGGVCPRLREGSGGRPCLQPRSRPTTPKRGE